MSRERKVVDAKVLGGILAAFQPYVARIRNNISTNKFALVL